MTNFTQNSLQLLSLSETSQIAKVYQTATNNDGETPNLHGSFNIGLHVQDNPQNVHQNRIKLLTAIQAEFPHIRQIHWLNQVHGDTVVEINDLSIGIDSQSADAHITLDRHIALAIMTADCVPVMVTSDNGEVVAGIHAGWQGLAKGIIFNTLTKMQTNSKNSKGWQAWIGACISRDHYEVDERVRTQVLAQIEDQLTKHNQSLSETDKNRFFTPRPYKAGHYLADLPAIAQFQLELCGLQAENIHLSGLDSYADERFYSYRRQTEQNLPFTGRMATLIFRG